MGCDVIAEQLHRHDRQQRAEQLVDFRHRQQGVKELRIRTVRGNPHQLGIPGLGLLGIAEHLVEDGARDRDRDNGHPSIQKGNRAVLHLAGGVTLGMDVADFLELQRPLEGNRIVDSPSQEDHVLGVREQMGHLLAAAVVVVHQAAQLLGQRPQTSDQLLHGLRTQNPRPAGATLGKRNGQSIEGQELTEEGLGGRHTHLNAGADVENLIDHPAQGAFGAVGDPEQAGCIGRIGNTAATLLLHRQGRQGVGGFARLGHTDGEGVRGERRRGVAEFAGIKDAGGDPSQLLKEIGPHQSGVAASATGEHLDALDAFNHALIEGQSDPR